MYQDLVVSDVLNDFCTGMIILHQDLKIKDDAVIDTVNRRSAVQDSICDKYDISRVIHIGLVVDRQVKTAGQNADDLILSVPVIGHVIARTTRLFVVKCDRKVECSVLSLFFVLYVLHDDSLLNG